MMKTSRRLIACLAVVTAAIAVAPPTEAYLKLGFLLRGQVVPLQWTSLPVRYLVTNRDEPQVTAAQLQTAVGRAFAEWGRPDNVTLSSQFQGFTNVLADVDDRLSVIGFRARPDLDRTLGATSFEFDAVTGDFIAADIFINSIFPWSVSSSGDSARWDLESIMVHEVGHLLGLGHSAIGETQPVTGGRTVLGKRAVMFPIAYPRGSVADRTLEADDVAGITDIYGTTQAGRDLGAIAGRVTLNGAGVFGAHITAFNAATGELVSGFSLDSNGEFVIASLKPGIYVVRAEPLDDADVDSFLDEDPLPVNLNFKVTYFSKQVAVPAGGSSGSIEIKVRPK